MRPADENQHPSKRPNLFASSRRTSRGDDNILARLERGMSGQPAHARLRRSSRAVIVGVALLMLGLTGTMAIMTRDNSPAPRTVDVNTPALLINTTQLPPALHAPAAIVEEAAPALALLPPAEVAPAAVSHPAPLHTPVHRVRAGKSVPRARAPAKPQVAASKAAPAKATVARPARLAAVAETDPDVAILTVILSHTPRHSGKRGAARACSADKPCQAVQY